MPRFSKKDRRELMSLNDKFKALHSIMILDEFNESIEEELRREEIIEIMNSTRDSIRMLYRPKSYKAKPTIEILGLISKETLYDEKKRIIIKKEQRITKLILEKLEENNFEEILVEEHEHMDMHKVMEILYSLYHQCLPKNNHPVPRDNTFKNAMDSILDEANSSDPATSSDT